MKRLMDNSGHPAPDIPHATRSMQNVATFSANNPHTGHRLRQFHPSGVWKTSSRNLSVKSPLIRIR